MGPMQIHLIAAIATFYVIAPTIVSADDVILQKRSERNRIDMDRFMEDERPRKRPFCNAFTGCGKKRSDESMNAFVEDDSESAVDELSKQIFTEAKLWQAIQEARAELGRRRQGKNLIPIDLPLGMAMSNFRRKRSPKKNQNGVPEEINDKIRNAKHR